MASQAIQLDNITGSLWWAVSRWTPGLKRGQARDLLRLLICKLYGAGRGNVMNAHVRASQAALGASLGVSREWTNELVSRLREAGWIGYYAPRLPDGRYEVGIFSAGRQLKRLLYILLAYRRRSTHRVNSGLPVLPPKEQIMRNKTLFQGFVQEVAAKLGIRQRP